VTIDLGTDLSTPDGSDLDPMGGVVSGRRALGQAIARRLITPAARSSTMRPTGTTCARWWARPCGPATSRPLAPRSSTSAAPMSAWTTPP
jgi:hypothetical protein